MKTPPILKPHYREFRMGDFLPVCSGSSLKQMPSPTPHSILVSVATCGTKSTLNSNQNLITACGASKIFLDNGMFTFFRKMEKGERVIFDNSRPIYPGKNSMNLTAVHAIQNALILKPNVLIVPDMPVPKLLKSSNYDRGDEEFHFIKVTYHNLIRAKETVFLRQKYCPDVQLYFAFQGYNINQLHRIMKELNGLQFEGYCLATRALKWNKLLALLLLFKSYGAKKIHILAGSSMPVMAIGAFAARHLFDEVSYDSHNWLYLSLKIWFRFFGSMGVVRPIKNIKIPADILSLRCDCPHCQGRSIADIREMEHGQIKNNLLAQHNFYIETETATAYFNHSETPEMLRDFLLSKSGRVKLILEMHKALSAIYQMKNYLNDMKFVNGLAEYIFNKFTAT
jgi:queuine/archaeosine tRNA-ribosyltransferase